jgi:hypothetical protein
MVIKRIMTVNKNFLFTVIFVFLHYTNSFCQLAYKCTYRYDTEALSVAIKPKNIDTNYTKQPIKVSIGDIFYINYSNSFASFTEIYFKQNEKIRIKYNKANATFYNNKTEKVYTIKDGFSSDSTFKYELPNFTNKIGSEKIGEYDCVIYEWVNAHQIKYKIWICKKFVLILFFLI